VTLLVPAITLGRNDVIKSSTHAHTRTHLFMYSLYPTGWRSSLHPRSPVRACNGGGRTSSPRGPTKRSGPVTKRTNQRRGLDARIHAPAFNGTLSRSSRNLANPRRSHGELREYNKTSISRSDSRECCSGRNAEIERAAIETQTTPAISLGFLRGYRKHVFWPDFTIIRMSRLSTILRSFGPMKGKQEDIDCDG